MRTAFVVAAAALFQVQATSAAIFENQLHTGLAGASFAPPTTFWTDVDTRVVGSITSPTNSSFVNWDVGIITPTAIRIQGSGFASSLGSNGVSLQNTMTVTLTEASEFTLTGNMSAGGATGNVGASISGPGILGVPLEPDGSLVLTVGSTALTGTLLPGEYTIRVAGSASGGGFMNSGSFGTNFTLIIPAPAATVPLLGVLVLAARRRR